MIYLHKLVGKLIAFAKGSKEVLIEGFIPADALKVIKEVSNE